MIFFFLASNTDLRALVNLTDEFEIALLKDKIQVFLENVKEEKPDVQLKYLKLANMMKFSTLSSLFNLLNQIGKGSTRFSKYRLIKEFYRLDLETMKLLAHHRLWYLLANISVDLLDKVQVEMNAILGIYLERQKKIV